MKFVVSLRRLELTLDEIAEILALRDGQDAPDQTLLVLIQQETTGIGWRIDDLLQMETELTLSTIWVRRSRPADEIYGVRCTRHPQTK